MQQQSVQYHIDAIRNILSLKPKNIKHTHRHLVYLDCYESVKKNTKNPTEQKFGVSKKIYTMGIITAYILIINMFISLFTEHNPMTILYIPTCLYILWANYSRIYANSPQQKLTLSAYIAVIIVILIMNTLLLIVNNSIIENSIEMTQNTQKTIFHPSIIYISIMIFTILISTINILYPTTTPRNQEYLNHIAFITNNIFVHHAHTPDPSEEARTNEYIQHMIHPLDDIIVIGHKSPIHAILTERYKKLPHNRTILEEHLHHLSCQVPLVYLTPSGNYIPKKA